MDGHRSTPRTEQNNNTNFYPLPVADVVVGSSSRREKIRRKWRRNRSMGRAGRRETQGRRAQGSMRRGGMMMMRMMEGEKKRVQ